jgi:threonine/homoserine/homoserine lactone efflux protein
MSIGAIAAFTTPDGNFFLQLGIIVLICVLFGTPNSFVWLAGGKFMQPILNDEKKLVLFNRVMGVLLALSVIPIFIH